MLLSARFSIAALCLAAPLGLLTVTLAGCGDSGGESAAVEEARYVVPNDEPGTPMSDTSFITVDNRIVGGRLISTTASKLNLTDEKPRRIIDGRQVFTKAQYTAFVNSPVLRLEKIFCPADAVVIMVNVGNESPFPLKSVSSADRDKFIPAPVLHDDIGNTYWPVGYFYKDIDNETLEINIDLSRQFKDLNRIPPLSRSKRQELTLIFQVNLGVNLTAISYGGHEKRTFNISTTDRF